jgi:hypothetical protein
MIFLNNYTQAFWDYDVPLFPDISSKNKYSIMVYCILFLLTSFDIHWDKTTSNPNKH